MAGAVAPHQIVQERVKEEFLEAVKALGRLVFVLEYEASIQNQSYHLLKKYDPYGKKRIKKIVQYALKNEKRKINDFPKNICEQLPGSLPKAISIRHISLPSIVLLYGWRDKIQIFL